MLFNDPKGSKHFTFYVYKLKLTKEHILHLKEALKSKTNFIYDFTIFLKGDGLASQHQIHKLIRHNT